MGRIVGWSAGVIPARGPQRRLVVQSAVFALGNGTFLTGSVVFFTQVVGLSPIQVGVGFSAIGLVGLVGAVPLGHLADRLGGRRAWVAGALAEAVCFACFPVAREFWAFIAVTVTAAIAQTLGNSGRAVYTAAAVAVDQRVRTFAFMRAYFNVGFTVGAGIGAAALAVESDAALTGIVLANAIALVANAWVVFRMPDVRAVAPGPRARPWGVLRDHPFTALSTLWAVLALHMVIFSEVLPLWAITMTDAPKPVLGGLFALNTVLAVLLQVPATRGADSPAGSVRLMRLAGLAMALACPLLALSGRTEGWLTVTVLALAVLLTTATELWSSAAQWYLSIEMPPADQRGAYTGAAAAVAGAGRMVGPTALILLAIQTGGWGWWVLAAVFVMCAALASPAVAWVVRTPRVGAGSPADGPGEPALHHGSTQ